MSDDNDLIIEDHEYDGIQELDNNLPTWWLWSFLGAIIFGALYWLHFSLSGDGRSLDQYLAEDMAQIEKMRAQAEAPSDSAQVSPEEILAQGKTTYRQYCASCHKDDGGGSVGPNLADKYWIHGNGSEEFLVGMIENGVLDKGMPAWKGLIKPNQIAAIAKYVVTLQGTEPADGKEPQGNLVE